MYIYIIIYVYVCVSVCNIHLSSFMHSQLSKLHWAAPASRRASRCKATSRASK